MPAGGFCVCGLGVGLEGSGELSSSNSPVNDSLRGIGAVTLHPCVRQESA